MAITLEIAFILVENVKKISLFAKNAAVGCYRTKKLLSANFSIIFYMIWKLVSNSSNVVNINAIAFIIKYKMWFLFFTRPTDFNWKYLHFERDKSYTYEKIVGNMWNSTYNTITANWLMTWSIWYLLQTTWNMLKMTLTRPFSHTKHEITQIFPGLPTIKILKIFMTL